MTGESPYTTKQVADRLGISHSRIRQLVLSLNLGRIIGRDRLLDDADVAVLQARSTVPGPKRRTGPDDRS